jgi:hypothetical protein
MENIKQAQLEMRNNHKGGATGIIVSGLTWLLTAFVAYNNSSRYAVWTLLIGGVFIHPISTIFNKILGVSGTNSKNNVLTNLAMEGTFFMLMCIPLAYGLSLQHPEWFFQGMLMIIGGRYLTFNTLYGTKLYWVLGATLGISGYLLFSLKESCFISALSGSIIEILFGIMMFYFSRITKKQL